MLDVYVLPISIESGKELPDLPGFFISASPRTANRHRSEEILILFLNTNENAAVPLSRLQSFFDNLAGTYFKTPGAVTAAIRALIKQLNDALLKSNLNKAREGKQTIGILNLAVIHKDQIYIVHSGDTHSLLLTPNQAEDFYHPEPAAHGLGLRDNPDLNYYQAQLQPGFTLVMSTTFPEGFVKNLPISGGRISLEQIRRRFNTQAADRTRVAVLQFQNGKGEVHFLKPHNPIPDSEIPEPEPTHTPEGAESTAAGPSLSSNFPPEDHAAPRRTSRHEPAPVRKPPNMARSVKPGDKKGWLASLAGAFSHSRPASSAGRETSPADREQVPLPPTPPPPATEPAGVAFFPAASIPPGAPDPVSNKPPSSGDSTSDTRQVRVGVTAPAESSTTGQPAPLDKDPWQKWLVPFFKGGQETGDKIKKGGGSLLVRMLPGDQEQLPQMSPSLMLVIAIAVPLVIAAVAVTIYYQLGPQKEYQDDMDQAEKTASHIAGITDPALQINAMEQTIQYLDQAEKHLVTDQSRSLRIQIQNELDDLDGIKRINYQPISDNLDGSVKITRILSNTTDTYLLDSTQGRIIRLTQTNQRYHLDYTFECGPGLIGISKVDKLVDFVLLPANTPNKATVMGIDRSGNLLYCIPGEKPLAKPLSPPDMGWGEIKGMIIDDDGLLYIMDTSGKSVFIYIPDSYTYPSPPRLYFNDQIPTDMNGMMDLTINRNELYLLNGDGHMVHCIFRPYSDSQTRCTDPNPYHDGRPGKSVDTNRVDGTQFKRVFVVGVPDPSIFILDTASSSVYQFSLRLTFYRQIQMQLYPDHKPVQPATAFNISPARIIWMAYGNEVFYGLLP